MEILALQTKQIISLNYFTLMSLVIYFTSLHHLNLILQI